MIKKSFFCMASHCEVLVDTRDPIVFANIYSKIKTEAERLERKYSRYRDDNIIYQINKAEPSGVEVDPETASLLGFAFECYRMSDGLFDITSGVLRKIWNFKNLKEFPSSEKIEDCRRYIGLSRVHWNGSCITLRPGMELDFGGIVKEYAVDKALGLIGPEQPATLINFGGDLAVTRRPQAASWAVAIEDAFKNNLKGANLDLNSGALATSGDAHRFFEHHGRRYSHILNPKTGYPVQSDIVSVTVHAQNCTLAGVMATISHLQPGPEAYLQAQNVKHWIVRRSSQALG